MCCHLHDDDDDHDHGQLAGCDADGERQQLVDKHEQTGVCPGCGARALSSNGIGHLGRRKCSLGYGTR